MKRSLVFNFVLLGLVLAIGATGCKGRRPAPGVIALPGQKKEVVDTGGVDTKPEVIKPIIPGTENPINEKPIKDTDLPPGEGLLGMIADKDKFKANTAYFDYDRAVVKPTERVKIEEVAVYLKGVLDHKLMIDGHCDERGTEEYNRALGERRALALREYLIKLGITGDRIYTRTFGEDRPALEGHDEAAWSKNRRGEFILLKPKPSAN